MPAYDVFDMWQDVLWIETVQLARQSPYCFSSDRYAHRDAADQIAKEKNLNEHDLKEWQEFIDVKTRYMSNYSGD